MAAAERLFAESSWEAVSVRSIVAAPGVNLAALNYHFGSKQELLREIFVTRAKPIVQERIRRLEEIRKREGTPCLEEILEGFLRPALGIDAQRTGGRFVKLRARLGAAPDAISRKILSDTFDESSGAFLTEIKRALPGDSSRGSGVALPLSVRHDGLHDGERRSHRVPNGRPVRYQRCRASSAATDSLSGCWLSFRARGNHAATGAA